MFPSIITFVFDHILGPFRRSLGPKGLFWESTHVVETLLFSMFPSILTFDYDIISRSFFTFWGPKGHFLSQGIVKKSILGLLISLNNIYFLYFLQF